MLISKALEGLVRLIWKVPFDRSKHVVDTGLIGAIGLAAKRQDKQVVRLQEATSRARPSQAGSDSTAQRLLAPNIHTIGSRTTVSSPPSVLRPEHLNQPYREDSDDETGYILGAWRYDEDLSTEPLTPPAIDLSPVSPQSSTGFSRVAGGRANMDSPYTISLGTGAASDIAPSRTAPIASLPPGAMPPDQFHTRRKSQSAIIEDATFSHRATAVATSAGTISQDEFSSLGDDNSSHPPRRKNWLQRALFPDSIGRDPRRSRHGTLADELNPPDAPSGSSNSPRTFVVIRERKPSPLSQAQLPEDQEPPDEGVRSFTVVRPPKTGSVINASTNLSTSSQHTNLIPDLLTGSILDIGNKP